ncbi:MAG: helicase HerA domain-containing protein [Acidimicrobiia bacterium]
MSFYLGSPSTAAGERDAEETLQFDPSDLTTHGVIVGMTGSGKTGLGVIYLEEALRSGIPTLILDPKGDMTNLLLTFPELAAANFEPWIDESEASKRGNTVAEQAAATAELWSKGLGSWNLSGSDIGELRASVDMTIYTPGSQAGVPLNIVGNMKPPTLSWDSDAETIRDEIQGIVSGLLALIDVDIDPISSREHILMSNLVEFAWKSDTTIDLPTLIGQVATPPIRKLGVFDIDTFFPNKDRMALAMKLNGLLASPSFAAWMDGEDLDIGRLLWNGDRPQASIIYLAHLSDAERQFIVTMILSKVITWMRSQPGSGELKALIYMDEVFGFVPPTAEPPAKKPILTILKQARAFGVGLLLSTQNPVDLDYKAMSNAGTWCIGRLQTERDKARILEALTSASGSVDIKEIDATISSLSKRVFVLHSTRANAPQVFTTRWAMSYLRGPMTREEIRSVTPDLPTPAATATSEPSEPATTKSFTPIVAASVQSSTLDPAAPWASLVGFDATGTSYSAAIALTVSTRYDDARLGLDHTETWESVLYPLSDPPDAANLIEVDHDARDFLPTNTDLIFNEPAAPIANEAYFDKLKRVVSSELDARRTLTLFRNRQVKLVSRPGEDRGAFAARCESAASDLADSQLAKLTLRFDKRIRTARRDYESAVRSADTAQQQLDGQRGDALMGLAFDLLSGRRPRSSRSSQRTAQTRVRKAEDKIETKRERFEDLQRELETEAEAIKLQWEDKATEIEDLEIGLEKDDITVTDIKLVWIRST